MTFLSPNLVSQFKTITEKGPQKKEKKKQHLEDDWSTHLTATNLIFSVPVNPTDNIATVPIVAQCSYDLFLKISGSLAGLS